MKHKNEVKNFLKQELIGDPELKKIRGEASTRSFYRVIYKSYSLVAMVYPQPALEEIERILRLTILYEQHGIPVPPVKNKIKDRILLMEDLGDISVQKAFFEADIPKRLQMLEWVVDILSKLQRVPVSHTPYILDTARMKWEMDFFLTHFAPHFIEGGENPGKIGEMRQYLYGMVDGIQPVNTFAHRDFHSRNMLLKNGKIYLVDFQDSLTASPYYDLVSFAYDAELDLNKQRDFLVKGFREEGMAWDEELYYLAALQRNIKALGTFGFQVMERKNLVYKRYIPRTLRHIQGNPIASRVLGPFYAFFQPAVVDSVIKKEMPIIKRGMSKGF